MRDEIFQLIRHAIPSDNARQTTAEGMVAAARDAILSTASGRPEILDLGTGDGRSFSKLSAIFPHMEWVGLDIHDSPEVSSRTRSDLTFVTYDGVNIPFDDRSFDLVYSKQVLEHVRYPDALVSQIARVLKAGGSFIGSVSQLEPYHSYSLFNWTVYGLFEVFREAGLKLRVLRPGIDGLSLILRRVTPHAGFNEMFSGAEGLLNHLIAAAHLHKADVVEENYQKLLCAGHIVFWAQHAE